MTNIHKQDVTIALFHLCIACIFLHPYNHARLNYAHYLNTINPMMFIYFTCKHINGFIVLRIVSVYDCN